MDFGGKRILVTGVGAGMGRSIAIKLASMGAKVFGISRTQSKLDSLKKECPTITVRSVNLGDWKETRNAVNAFLPLDMVVNNAGQIVNANAIDQTEEEYDKVFNVNVKAVANTMQVVAHDLIARNKKGSFVTISSVRSQRPGYGVSAYNASKAAADMLTRSFAIELAPHGIRVNSVCPTLCDTDLVQEFINDKKFMEDLMKETPLGRIASKDDVVNAVVFLLSDASSMTTGHSFPVDGGFWAL